MTKEQEVIKYIETRIKICNENADICDDNDFDEEATYLREESYMLETALNMLKEKDRQINSKNGTINALQCALKERTEERDKKADIVTKQDKIIEQINKNIEANIYLAESNYNVEELNDYARGVYDTYINMRKQYFERKSEE